LSDPRIQSIIRSVQKGVRWLKDSADVMQDDRDLAITISALVAAEKNPHSHLVQRLTATLIRQQAMNGSWNDELWDTAWAGKALSDVGYEITDPPLERALRFIEANQDPLTGTWYDELFETLLVLDLIARLAPERMSALGDASLNWLASLQKPDGSVIAVRQTGMVASLFCLTKKLGLTSYDQVIELAIQYIHFDMKDKPIWNSASWSNYYPLQALLDYGKTLDDPLVAKAVDWFLASQESDGQWKQVSGLDDTAMAVLALSGLLTTPLVDVSNPRTAILNVIRENGIIRVSIDGPGIGAMTLADRIKLSPKVRSDLSQNQQLVMTALGKFRSQSRTRSSGKPRRNARHKPRTTVPLQLEKTGKYAFRQLIPNKIQYQLENSSADHLRLDLDERLIDLPWELIHDGTEFLCLRYAFGRRLVSTQSFDSPSRRVQPARNTRVLIVADPTGDLPAARQEGREVGKLLRDKCGMQVDEFSASGLNKMDFLLSVKEYDIVHFAGHASHRRSSPDESCLVFCDGEIQAFEIERFIRGRSPAVVFLNACWSAEELRNPDSYTPMMRGLGRTFLYAGVTAFLGYLVPVPDDTATQFAFAFYEALAQGQTIGESLRQARIQSRDPKWPDNLTWSSAMLYGDPAARAVEADSRGTL
jgi:CHAT domain-containing protein